MRALLPLLGVAAVLAAPAHAAEAQDDLAASVRADMPGLMELYRDLHAHPELSFAETRTAAKLAAMARDLGFEVTEKVGRTGVVAVMRNGEGPVVMIRADMDGLPVTEQTGLPYASKVRAMSMAGVESGVMHACGHDTHMAGWVGTARQLSRRKAEWSGTLVMILQPAEEIGSGAKAMLDDGLYTRFPKPDYVLGFHDAAEMPAGVVGVTPGYALANVDSVDLVVKGVGGHGAYPHRTNDPVVIASAIVMRLQTLVSREIDPQEPAVVTVGAFQAGSKHNIIPPEARLLLTVRSYSDETRQALLEGIKRIARAEAMAAGLPEDRLPEMTINVDGSFTPATFNDEPLAERMAALFRKRLGEQQVIRPPAVMGGEDFSQYRRADPDNVESLIFWVGGVPADELARARADGRSLPGLHSPYWAPDAEKVIATGAEALTAATLDLMPRR